MKLHLGCGKIVLPGWTNVDTIPSTQKWERNPKLANKIHNVNLILRWPWVSESVRLITVSHLLYCFDDNQRGNLIEESYRVLKPGGILRVTDDDNDHPSSKYHERKHHNAKERLSKVLMIAIMVQAGFEVLEMSHGLTQADDPLIMQDLHKHAPEYPACFFIEAMK